MKQLYSVKFLILVILVLGAVGADAQSVTSVNARINDSKLEIVYQMGNLRNGQKFNVELFSSVDNYAAPIIEGVEGDVGEDLALKFENVMTIADPIETLGFITSDIQFKVIAHLVYNPVELTMPMASFKVKRGKTVAVSWRGGLAGEDVSFNLYRNNELIIKDLAVVPNTGSTEVRIPKKQQKGEGYNLEMHMASIESPVKLPDFTVKKKKGWIALLVIGALGYLAYDYVTEGPVTEAAGFGTPEALPNPPSNPDQFNGALYKNN